MSFIAKMCFKSGLQAKQKRKESMQQKHDKFYDIVPRISENVDNVRYGTVSVTLRIHDGRVVDITHSVTENIRANVKNFSKEVPK